MPNNPDPEDPKRVRHLRKYYEPRNCYAGFGFSFVGKEFLPQKAERHSTPSLPYRRR
jgi:hypothetical protein